MLPPRNLLPNAPTQSYFHTQVYYNNRRPGSEAAARKLAQLFVPADVGPLPRDRRLRSLDPGALVVVVVGSVFHGQLSSGPPPPPAPVHVPPNVSYEPSVGLQLLQPLVRSAGFRLEVPTVLEKTSTPDNQYGDVAARLYWIDKAQNAKAVRLVFVDGQNEYWGVEETDMPNPPILADRSFHRVVKGRTFSLYYTGSNLHMVVLRDGNRSYWVVNTLLDSLSNETMLAIAEGLRPLQPAE